MITTYVQLIKTANHRKITKLDILNPHQSLYSSISDVQYFKVVFHVFNIRLKRKYNVTGFRFQRFLINSQTFCKMMLLQR